MSSWSSAHPVHRAATFASQRQFWPAEASELITAARLNGVTAVIDLLFSADGSTIEREVSTFLRFEARQRVVDGNLRTDQYPLHALWEAFRAWIHTGFTSVHGAVGGVHLITKVPDEQTDAARSYGNSHPARHSHEVFMSFCAAAVWRAYAQLAAAIHMVDGFQVQELQLPENVGDP